MELCDVTSIKLVAFEISVDFREIGSEFQLAYLSTQLEMPQKPRTTGGKVTHLLLKNRHVTSLDQKTVDFIYLHQILLIAKKKNTQFQVPSYQGSASNGKYDKV